MRRTKRKDRQPQGGEDRAKFDKLRITCCASTTK